MGRVLVDTSVWSLALRRRGKVLSAAQRALVSLLRELIVSGEATLMGIIRQEVLTGIKDDNVFARIASRRRDFDEITPDSDDYKRAAAFGNQRRNHGVAITPVDMLICAVPADRGLPILTTDLDFSRYTKHLPCVCTVRSMGKRKHGLMLRQIEFDWSADRLPRAESA